MKKKGLELEREFSREFHQEGIPLLVSPSLLRSRNLGQVDLSRLKKDREGWVIEVGEVKSSQVGEEQMLRFQRQRIFSAQNFLSAIFGHRTKLLRLIKK